MKLCWGFQSSDLGSVALVVPTSSRHRRQRPESTQNVGGSAAHLYAATHAGCIT